MGIKNYDEHYNLQGRAKKGRNDSGCTNYIVDW